jgi:hypothetical protein
MPEMHPIETPLESKADRRRSGVRLRLILIAVLTLGIVGQMAFLLDDFILPWGWRVKQVWDQPRIVRSADMSLGAPATRVIKFVRSVTPEDATIVLPPEGDPGRFALARSMQYFFFPRRLIECGSAESDVCVRALASAESYVIATPDFPSPVQLSGKAFMQSPSTGMDWFTGLYGPGFVQAPQEEFSLRTALIAGAKDLALLLALCLLGFALVYAIDRDLSILEKLSLALPSGAGVLTWALFVLSWIGVRLTLTSVATVYLAALLAAALMILRRKSSGDSGPGSSGREHGPGFNPQRVLILLAATGILGLSVAMSVGTSYRLYDPVQIWSVKGYAISREGTILAADAWGEHGLAYPLNIPLQISLFHLVDGDYLPGSKLLFPLFGLSLCLIVYSYMRRRGVDEAIAGLSALFLGSVPIVFFHTTDGFANLPFTVAFVAGILWGVEGIRSKSSRLQALAGMLLGLACWTRPEGILYGLGAVVVFWLGGLAVRQGRFSFAAISVPLALIAGAWFVFALSGDTMHGSNLDEGTNVFMARVLAGQIDLTAPWNIFRYFARGSIIPFQAMFPSISATAWGAFFPVTLIALVLGWSSLVRRNNTGGVLLWLQLLWAAGLNLGVFYVRTYSRPGYQDFIERSFPRAFLPTAVLMLMLGIWGIDMLARRRPGDVATEVLPAGSAPAGGER